MDTMSKTDKILALAAAIILPMSAFAADWQPLYEEDPPNVGHIAYFVDRSTLLQRGHIVSAWILSDYSEANSIKTEDGDFEDYKSTKVLINVNCSTHRLAVLDSELFADNMGRGRMLNQASAVPVVKASDLNWVDPQVWDFAERQSQLLCRNTGVKYTPVKNAPTISTLILGGVAHRLVISPARKDILVAAVTPNTIPTENTTFGLYTISLHDPKAPTKLGYFPILNPADFVLSPDGKTAYVISYRQGGFPEDEKQYGLFVWTSPVSVDR